jgi:hypothetical protein
MEKNKRIYVLTANRQHFVVWCKENGYSPRDRNIVYVSGPEILLGVDKENAQFFMYHAYKHPQYFRILQEVKIIETR